MRCLGIRTHNNQKSIKKEGWKGKETEELSRKQAPEKNGPNKIKSPD